MLVTYKILFWLTLIVLMVVILRYSHKVQMIFNTSSLSMFTPDSFSINNRPDYSRHVKKGLAQMSQRSVTICGLVRDVEDNMTHIVKRVEQTGNLFREYRVLIVENDSTDQTRPQLLEWSRANPRVTILGCGYNAPVCQMKRKKTVSRFSIDRERIQKMVDLRNIYLQELKRAPYSQMDYTIMWDLDITGSLYIDGLAHTISQMEDRPEIQVMCSSGIHRWFGIFDEFYDCYAYLDKGSDFHIDSQTLHSLKTKLQNQTVRGDPIYEVTSCFSGFAVYRTAALQPERVVYDMSPEEGGNLECEHVRLHRKMKGIYLNPSMIHRIIRNR